MNIELILIGFFRRKILFLIYIKILWEFFCGVLFCLRKFGVERYIFFKFLLFGDYGFVSFIIGNGYSSLEIWDMGNIFNYYLLNFFEFF